MSTPKVYETRLESAQQVALCHALQFYLDHGLVLTRIHRVVAFTQHPFMLLYVAYYNEQRKNAKSEIESNLYMLLANSFYGKTCENVRRRCNVRLIADEKSSSEPSQKPTTKKLQALADHQRRPRNGRMCQNENTDVQTDSDRLYHTGVCNTRNVSVLLRLPVAEIWRPTEAVLYRHRQSDMSYRERKS